MERECTKKFIIIKYSRLIRKMHFSLFVHVPWPVTPFPHLQNVQQYEHKDDEKIQTSKKCLRIRIFMDEQKIFVHKNKHKKDFI